MTDLREKLADVAEVAIDNVHDMDVTLRDYAEAAAQAFIAALPGMIEPLVWDGFVSGPYKIEVHDGGIADLWFYGVASEDDEGPELLQGGYLTLVSIDDLKAAAQAHHVATSLAAFGVQGGEA